MEARAEGYLPVVRVIVVPARGLAREPLVFVRAPRPAGPAPVTPEPPWRRPRHTAGVILGAAALGSLATGIAFHVIREERAGSYNDAKQPGPQRPRRVVAALRLEMAVSVPKLDARFQEPPDPPDRRPHAILGLRPERVSAHPGGNPGANGRVVGASRRILLPFVFELHHPRHVRGRGPWPGDGQTKAEGERGAQHETSLPAARGSLQSATGHLRDFSPGTRRWARLPAACQDPALCCGHG
jgi:hypothetical protein